MSFDVRDLAVPIVQAPMAGGPSTPALAAAVSEAGGLGFLAAGYLTAEKLAADIAEVRAATAQPFGVNVFVESAQPGSAAAVDAYAESLQGEAERYGVALGEPRFDDDAYGEKLAVLVEARVPVVSFTFGLPSDDGVAALHRAGSAVWATVTDPAEGALAAAAGAEALIAQGTEAGGHRGFFSDQDEHEELGLLALLALLADQPGLPLIAAGGIVNRFLTEHDADAPPAYPEVHHVTSPLRAAARSIGDGDAINLWAGQAHRLARERPASWRFSHPGQLPARQTRCGGPVGDHHDRARRRAGRLTALTTRRRRVTAGRRRSGPHNARMGALSRWAAMVSAVLAVTASSAAGAQVSVLARIPAPGYPSSTVVSKGTIYAGTFKSFTLPTAAGPSKVFAFSSAGALQRTYTVSGQAAGAADAAQVATVDRAGTLYLLDQDPARVVKLNPQTGAQSTWATFSEVPACSASHTTQCTDGLAGNSPEPDFATWGPGGSLYVTDYNQSLIWRVPPGGGAATVWLTSSLFNGLIVGPAGIQLMADGNTLMISTGGGGADPTTGKLYTVPILPGDRPGPLHQLWASSIPAAAPDGFALARSGDVYLSQVGPLGNDVLEISPQGRQIASFSGQATGADGAMIPFDAPGSVTFDGDDVIVTNEASLSNADAHWALFQIAVGEPGLPLSLPPAPAAAKTKPHKAKHHKPKRHRKTKRHHAKM